MSADPQGMLEKLRQTREYLAVWEQLRAGHLDGAERRVPGIRSAARREPGATEAR